MKQRIIQAELLDELDSNHPDAIRSRRDLRFVNTIMRGEKWIVKNLLQMPNIKQVIELGAGEGHLCKRIHNARPDISITAVDLAPRPADLPTKINWLQQDIMEINHPHDASTAIVANLFIHHFEDSFLREWFSKHQQAGAVLLAEPYRAPRFMRVSKLTYPFVNHVTRHDMKISIEAGFEPGEMTKLLENNWHCDEHWNIAGSLRCKGIKQ